MVVSRSLSCTSRTERSGRSARATLPWSRRERLRRRNWQRIVQWPPQYDDEVLTNHLSEAVAMSEHRAANVSLDSLLLDPNNFRFQDDEDFVSVEATRFHEPAVQARANDRLKKDVADLKRSIRRSGFIPVERLVV